MKEFEAPRLWYDADFMTKYHLIGIGGSGLSAIALVLLESGQNVSGSDRQFSPAVLALQQAGARVYLGHHAEHVRGADLVLRSSAIPDDNVEVQAALKAGIPVLKRVDFLQRLLSGKDVIAIAGTHGKTTTTAMTAWMLRALYLDPSYIIGGVASNLGHNAHAGGGSQFVIEADEYDHMFLGLNPSIAVVTNVEHDHPDCYPTPEDFNQAFRQFIARLEPNGTLIACGDDPGAADLTVWAKDRSAKVLTYGIGGGRYDYWAQRIDYQSDAGCCFEFHKKESDVSIFVSLGVGGAHNIQNALAALCVADMLGLDLQEAAHALSVFSGVGRRFEVRGVPGGVTLIDDYAHHPTEIRATLAAARERYSDRVLWVVWQPHTYSRTRMLLGDYVESFDHADFVLVTDIYAAREAPPVDGFSSRDIVDAIRYGGQGTGMQVYDMPSLSQARDFLLTRIRPGDVVLVLSAGDAIQISDELVLALGVFQGAEV